MIFLLGGGWGSFAALLGFLLVSALFFRGLVLLSPGHDQVLHATSDLPLHLTLDNHVAAHASFRHVAMEEPGTVDITMLIKKLLYFRLQYIEQG